MTGVAEQVKVFSDLSRSMKSIERAAANAMRILSKMSEVPQTFETPDTLYVLPSSARDARLFTKAWYQLFPKPANQSLIHNGGKPRRRT